MFFNNCLYFEVQGFDLHFNTTLHKLSTSKQWYDDGNDDEKVTV